MRTRSSQSQKPSTLPATLDHMRNCEAREWLERYREIAFEHGANKAKRWWNKIIYEIERIRGIDAADDLRRRMNKVKNESVQNK